MRFISEFNQSKKIVYFLYTAAFILTFLLLLHFYYFAVFKLYVYMIADVIMWLFVFSYHAYIKTYKNDEISTKNKPLNDLFKLNSD